jgi:hypothetical protein
MSELKHVGRVIATNKKCVIAYRTLPGDAYHCLIVATENLPDSYHDSIINLVESNAGQTAYEFAEALGRGTFPDGANMLRALHSTGRLLKVPTSAIEMTPTTSVKIQLSELNQIIAEQRGVPVDELAVKPTVAENADNEYAIEKPKKEDNDFAKTSSASVNESAETVVPTEFDTPEAEAKFYRSQADKLAKEAAAFRRKAEELVPTAKKKTA